MRFLDKIKKHATSKLSNKMILAFFALIILVIGILSIVIYGSYSTVRTNDYILSSKSKLDIFNNNFDNYISEVSDLSLNFRNDNQFMQYITQASDDYNSQAYIESSLKLLFYTRKDIQKLDFYLPINNKLYTISREKPYIQIKYVQNYSDNTWYNSTIKKNSFEFIEPYIESTGKDSAPNIDTPIFLFHRTIIDIQTQKPIGVVTFLMNYKKTSNIFFDENIESNEIVALLDNQNNIYFYNDSVFYNIMNDVDLIKEIDHSVSNGDFTIHFNNTEYKVIYDISAKRGWVMLKLIPDSQLKKGAADLFNFTIFIGLVLILISIPLLVLISKAITKPLKNISEKMDSMGNGDFNAISETKGNDEIAILSNTFNSMVVRIRNLIMEKYKAEVSEKNASIKALEAQVNPHFLNNSLQAIATMALKNGAEDIYDMIESLASNLRYTIKSKERVSIEEELVFLTNYYSIQKARFGDRLSIEYEIEESTLKTIIPKMSIQILVENAIIHGMEVTTEEILICVKACKNKKNIVISVVDNGVGISPNKMDEILKKLDEKNWMDGYNDSIGIINVNFRLKHLYNGNAFIRINSVKNSGTKIDLVLPIEGELNV